MNITQCPTKETVRKYFDYNDGTLVWKPRSADMFSIGKYQNRCCNMWNLKHAGKSVGADNGTGYLVARVNGITRLVSRLVYIYFNGDIGDYEIDHINRNKQDNRIENLRVADRSLNIRNTGIRKNNISGVKGVCQHKRDMRWYATIGVDGKKKHLGAFATKSLAEMARKNAESVYCGY